MKNKVYHINKDTKYLSVEDLVKEIERDMGKKITSHKDIWDRLDAPCKSLLKSYYGDNIRFNQPHPTHDQVECVMAMMVCYAYIHLPVEREEIIDVTEPRLSMHKERIIKLMLDLGMKPGIKPNIVKNIVEWSR